MLLGISPLSVGVCQTAIPPAKSYNQVQFIGECTLDNIHLIKEVLTDEEIIYRFEPLFDEAEIIDDSYSLDDSYSFNDNNGMEKLPLYLFDITNVSYQTWDDFNTIFLANFENTLEAGNLTNSDLPITHYRIYRKETGEGLYTFLDEIAFNPDQAIYIDYTAVNGVQYDYGVRSVSSGTEGQLIQGVGIVDFSGWILQNESGTILYNFDIEIESGNIQTVINMHKYENNTKYPVVAFGNMNYQEGSLQTLPLSINGNDYEQSIDYLETLRNFINNGEVKILKNSKGSIWKIVTYGYSYKLMDKTIEQYATISFSFTEVGE